MTNCGTGKLAWFNKPTHIEGNYDMYKVRKTGAFKNLIHTDVKSYRDMYPRFRISKGLPAHKPNWVMVVEEHEEPIKVIKQKRGIENYEELVDGFLTVHKKPFYAHKK